MSYETIVIDAIRKNQGAISKKRIQEITGLAWGTMHKTVGFLMTCGAVVPSANTTDNESKTRGRPMENIEIFPEFGYYIALDIGTFETKAIVCNFLFRIIASSTIPTTPFAGSVSFFALVNDVLKSILNNSGIPKEKVLGIGIAFSGIVDMQDGVIVSSTGMGMPFASNIPLAATIQKKWQKPTKIMTSSSATSWGEYQFGKWAGYANIVTVSLGSGINSGVIIDHQHLVSKPNHRVGHIGHMMVSGNTRKCVCGYYGCISAYSGGRSLRQIAREIFPDYPHMNSAESLDSAAARGNMEAKRVLDTAASYNAAGIVNMIQCYVPDVLIFSGGQSQPQGYLYLCTLKNLFHTLPAERRKNLNIDITTLGKFHAALGAAHLTFQQTFSQKVRD